MAITQAQEARVAAFLAKPWRVDGIVMTDAERMKKYIADGGVPAIRIEDAIKPLGRREAFNADNAKQQAHNARKKEAGTKKVYIMQFPDGVFIDLAKISFDYALTLMPAGFVPETTDCTTLHLEGY